MPQEIKVSQEERILEYLKTGGTLSPMDALSLFKCWALSSRISTLNKRGAKEGWHIKSMPETKDGKTYARYYYVGEPADTEHEEILRHANLAQETAINRQAFEEKGQMAWCQ